MVRKLFKAVLVLLLIVCLTGCGKDHYYVINQDGTTTEINEPKTNKSITGDLGTFTVIEEKPGFDSKTHISVVYDNQTNIMYYYITGLYVSTMSPIYDSSGNVMKYKKNYNSKEQNNDMIFIPPNMYIPN